MQPEEKKIMKQGFSLSITLDAFNKRARTDDCLGQVAAISGESIRIAREMNAEKLIFKARKEHALHLLEKGFLLEACIPGYFLGSDCYLFSKYFTEQRRNSAFWTKEDLILEEVTKLKRKPEIGSLPAGYGARRAVMEDADELAALYSAVFEIYPVPMNDPEYIKKCMGKDTVFYICTFGGRIVSAASAECSAVYHNAELTDCATLPDHRQFGLMKILLSRLEEHLFESGTFCVYSIARSLSFGMNAAFHQLDYTYKGRMANNCYIFDKLEDMNVWVKNLA
ncbi:putative beta-lysine N-acetyltransferase [Actinomycetes bacterium NPDC127524]